MAEIKVDPHFAAEYIRGLLTIPTDHHLSIKDLRRAFETFELPPDIESKGYAYISGRNAAATAVRTAERRDRAIEELKAKHEAEITALMVLSDLRVEFTRLWGLVGSAGFKGNPDRKMRILWGVLNDQRIKDLAEVEKISVAMAEKEAQRGRKILEELGASGSLLYRIQFHHHDKEE
jgi:DNA-directed RNA polymerase specialized sigma24 family protein